MIDRFKLILYLKEAERKGIKQCKVVSEDGGYCADDWCCKMAGVEPDKFRETFGEAEYECPFDGKVLKLPEFFAHMTIGPERDAHACGFGFLAMIIQGLVVTHSKQWKTRRS